MHFHSSYCNSAECFNTQSRGCKPYTLCSSDAHGYRFYFSLWIQNVCFSNNTANTEMVSRSLGTLTQAVVLFPLQSQPNLYKHKYEFELSLQKSLASILKKIPEHSAFLIKPPTGTGAIYASSHSFRMLEMSCWLSRWALGTGRGRRAKHVCHWCNIKISICAMNKYIPLCVMWHRHK